MTPLMRGTLDANAIAKTIIPTMSLSDVMRIPDSRLVDLCVWVKSCEAPRSEMSRGVQVTVANAECLDEDSKAEIAGWGTMAVRFASGRGFPTC